MFCSWCGIASLSRPPFAPKCQGKTLWRCFGWAAPCPPALCPRRTRSQVYLHAGGPHANTPGPSAHPGITSAARSIPSVAAGSAPQLFPGRCSARGPACAPFEETANPIICSFLSQREISEHSPAAECGLPPASPALPLLPCAQGRGGGSPGLHGCAPRSGDLGPYKTGTLQNGDPTSLQQQGVKDLGFRKAGFGADFPSSHPHGSRAVAAACAAPRH